MKILFDLTATQPSQGKFHGGGEYAKALFSNLLKVKNNEKISGFYNPAEWLDPKIDKLTKEHKVKMVSVKKIKDLEIIIKKEGFDRVYTALPYRYYNTDFFPAKLVITLHGLRDLEMPTDRYEFLYNRKPGILIKWLIKMWLPKFYHKLIKSRIERLLKKIDNETKILVDSQHTKFSLVNFFPYLEDEKIIVLYPPEKEVSVVNSNKVRNNILQKFNIQSKEYIFLIGGERWIKNAYRAVKALDAVFSEHSEIEKKVFLIGGNSLSSIFLKLENRDRFVFSDYVEDFELEILYKNSYIFIFPTLNEGFGYPPLEAMKYGIPVAGSAISSVCEICGDAILYFNPFSLDEIKNRILMLLLDKKLYKKFSSKAITRFKEISKKQKIMQDKLHDVILKG